MHKRKILCCLAMGLCLSLIWTTDTYAQKISAGANHALLIKKDGSLWTWGSNANGQLGTDSNDDESTPTRIGSDNNWFEIEAGESHSLAIKTNGTMWAWGKNEFGRLGDGTTDDNLTPTQVGADSNWKAISAGKEHSLAIKADGTLWAWGRNEFGQLGDGSLDDKSEPIQVGADTDWASVSAGYYHSAAIKTDGTLWIWGDNRHNFLGDEATVNCTEPSISNPTGDYVINFEDDYGDGWNGASIKVIIDGNESLYTLDDGFEGSEVVSMPNGAVSLSFEFVSGDWDSEITFTIVNPAGSTISSEGLEPLPGPITLYLCAEGKVGKRKSPIRVNGDTNWSLVTTGNSNTMAIKSDGTLWAWGANSTGQLGDGSTNDLLTPFQVGSDDNWKAVVEGDDHTLATKSNGTLWAVGGNINGQLGVGTSNSVLNLVQVGSETSWTTISAGYWHSLGVKNDGTVLAWGTNRNGEAGEGTGSLQIVPGKTNDELNWTKVYAGTSTSLGVKTDGTIWGWGSNSLGQFGTGLLNYESVPVQVSEGESWESISIRRSHVLALKSDGTLWSWGWNSNGQLGDGTTTNRSLPVQVGTDVDWKSVFAGHYSSFAIKDDGSLWAWGNNPYGGLGDGTTIYKTSPTQVGSDTDWAFVSEGRYHTIALKEDGTLWSWGFNDYGQLGDGTNTSTNTPAQVGTDSDWSIVRCGFYNSFGVKIDGTLWAWGYNFAGQLGDGTTEDRSSPVQIGTDSDWTNIEPGFYHNTALKNDGTLWAWGENGGAIGDGTTTDRSSPTQVGDATDWVETVAGNGYSMAIKSDGTLWAWGGNLSGQLGNGAAFKKSPQQVKTVMDLQLSANEIPEAHTNGTEVGVLSIINESGEYMPTLSLAAGVGSADNASFTISGSSLVTATMLDLQAKPVYSVRIQATDEYGNTFAKAFTINRVNSAPTALALDGTEIAENLPENTKVGLLSSTDSDEGDTHTYTLVAGEGSTDNASFVIQGNELQTAAVLDFEAKASLSVRIQTRDEVGAVVSDAFVITIIDANDAPTAISLSASEFTENLPIGSELATLSVNDQDETDNHTYTLVTGEGDTDNASFTISGDKLLASTVLDFETKSAYTIRVQSEDSDGKSFSQAFALTIINASDLPSDILLSASEITEQIVGGFQIGLLSTTDQDEGDTHTYELVTGDGSTDNSLFSIADNKLLTNEAIADNKKEAYSVRIQSKDASEGVFSKAFSISTANLKSEQTITFDLPSSVYPDQSPLMLSATASSGLPVSFELVSGSASFDGNQLTFTGPGELSVKALQAGDATNLPASISKTLLVKPFLSITLMVNKAEGVVLETGTATLLTTEGAVAGEESISEGSLEIGGLKEGNYVLQVSPLQSEASLFSITYYPSALTFEEAETINLTEDISLTMTMVGKEEVVQGLEAEFSSLQMYPNPVSDQLTISLNSERIQMLQYIEVYSMSGQQIIEISFEKAQTQLHLNLNKLQSGVYFLKLEFTDGISVGRFVKQ
ncbi:MULTISPECIES: T9SS type A sorting domain-containing protein [unclassified Imperialibacter]|uniref:RCC1 domain-containing protein n=1 Tax=unclassified Imperialibacter TaxID=2629706 RepID=UPI00186A59B0|nr:MULTISPECIES: T9SS type A sorting domain-containing protein [unclassified Imperialibacter]